MRALCEACAQPQPPDWKPGDLCVHCGQAVRHELRCFWCAKWTPAAKYCRSCGAECVEERLFGAARMIKAAGTDRFTVPKMLRELDPDQIENFTRIYQRQAVLVARQVDDLRFLERFLHHRVWSARIEDRLIAQLPWDDDLLARFTVPPLPPGDDLTVVKAIQASSPLREAYNLADIVRVRLGDWEDHSHVCGELDNDDAELRDEAALTVSGWRVLTALDFPRNAEQLITVLRASSFTLAAAVRIAQLSRTPVDPPPGALTADDPDIAFTAALVLGDRDRLCAALDGDDLMRIAAGRKLVRMGEGGLLARTLADSSEDVRQELVAALASAKKPVPELTEVLLALVEQGTGTKAGSHTSVGRLRERAARVICYAMPPSVVLRLARAAEDDKSIIQSLLQIAVLSTDELVDLGVFLVEQGRFAMHQYGLSTVAENGRLPDGFVPTHFARADDKTRAELCRFAEIQLGKRGDEALHRFMLQVVYGDHPGVLRACAWSCLHRWYRQDDVRGEGPLKLEPAVIARFFGSVGAFLPRLTAVLHDRASLKEVMLFDHLANLLGYADPAIVPAILAEEREAHALALALMEVVETKDYYAFLRTGAAKLLALIGGHPRWRDEVVARLEAKLHEVNYDFIQCVKRTLATITGGEQPP